jgi:hypothetical protein
MWFELDERAGASPAATCRSSVYGDDGAVGRERQRGGLI